MAKKGLKKGEIIIYKTPQNEIELEVHFEKENIWLTQNQIALLFGTQRPVITKHLKNIFQSGELEEKVVSSILEHTTKHGAIKGRTQTKNVKFYNLDAIISVGYQMPFLNVSDIKNNDIDIENAKKIDEKFNSPQHSMLGCWLEYVFSRYIGFTF